jgi:hypothetical protein
MALSFPSVVFLYPFEKEEEYPGIAISPLSFTASGIGELYKGNGGNLSPDLVPAPSFQVEFSGVHKALVEFFLSYSFL